MVYRALNHVTSSNVMKIEKIDGYVTSGVVKHYFSLPKSSFEALVKQGMPHLCIGGVRRFKLAEVEAWLKERGDKLRQEKRRRLGYVEQGKPKSPFAR